MQTNVPQKFTRAYKKSEVIFEENSQGSEMFVIYSGKVRIFTQEPGYELDLDFLGSGEFFGEMALVDSSPRSATAIAMEDDTRLVILDQSKFLYLVSQQPVFALTIMHALCKSIRERWELLPKLLEKQRADDEGKRLL